MARKKISGTCRLCLKDTILSFEHVPPRSAFNNYPVVKKTLDQMLSASEKHGDINQRGAGAHTLCGKCNNDTGTWYGGEYVKWAKSGLEFLQRVPKGLHPIDVTIRDVYPLRFMKQVIAMFFSTNRPDFAHAHPKLVKFVLDKYEREWPKDIHLYCALVRGSAGRKSGIFSRVNTETGCVEVISEIAYPPFVFELVLSSTKERVRGQITHFSAFTYDEKKDIDLSLISGEIASSLPGDYRTRDQIVAQGEENLGRELTNEDRHCLIKEIDDPK